MLLYNKMELGDLNANFTLEVESQVKKKFFMYHSLLFSFHIDTSFSSLSSSPLYLWGDLKKKQQLLLKLFDWSYFTAKIMNTVNISVPDTEKVINYSPNYYRRLNLILAKYTKR